MITTNSKSEMHNNFENVSLDEDMATIWTFMGSLNFDC